MAAATSRSCWNSSRGGRPRSAAAPKRPCSLYSTPAFTLTGLTTTTPPAGTSGPRLCDRLGACAAPSSQRSAPSTSCCRGSMPRCCERLKPSSREQRVHSLLECRITNRRGAETLPRSRAADTAPVGYSLSPRELDPNASLGLKSWRMSARRIASRDLPPPHRPEDPRYGFV